MHGPPSILYVGRDADAVESAWRDRDDEFVVTGIAPSADVVAALADGQFDAVVCHSDGSFDARGLVERVRTDDERLPVVLLASDESVDAGAAAELGVESFLHVEPDFDRAATVERLRPLIDRRREERRERTMLTSLLENVPLSIYFKDRQSRHVRLSDGVTDLTGPGYLETPDGKRHHTPEDVVGKSDFDLYPPDLAESAVADDRQVIETGESIEDRIEHSYGDDLDGTYVTTSKAPWRDEHGNVLGVVGVTRNITQRKRYEKQLERQNERLERFASVISHDLRNPLEVALGRLEFAREDGDEEHFDSIERSLHRIDALIDDVLTLAREGETVSDPEPTDLAETARAAWSVVETDEATLSVETDAVILADPSRLQQLFENVYRNSVAHGGSAVAVAVGDLPDRQGFFVEDDGPGIPESDREDVFDAGYSTSDEGTGLGLSIVRSIAEAHGWNVAATESEAGGARFEFGEQVAEAADQSDGD